MGPYLDIKPPEYCFDPAPLDTDYASKNHFPFLRAALTENIHGLEHSNCFNPRDMGLPWPTTFPAAVQSQHWREAQEAVRELMEQIHSTARIKDHETKQCDNVYDEKRRKRDLLIIDTAASSAISLFPAANGTQARTLAKATLLVFLHDDEADSEGHGAGANILKEVVDEIQSLPDELAKYQGPWKNPIFQEFVGECVRENSAAGLQVVQGLLMWTKHTLDHPPKEVEFSSWSEYVNYRIRDSLVLAASGMLQFSCGISVPESERRPFEAMYRLFMMHLSLTNDLYSYEKERLEAEKEGVTAVNGVQVLSRFLIVPSQTAKNILRQIILDLERQLHHVYDGHVQAGKLSDRQLRYARSMLEGLSGNLFGSSTQARYARVVPGTRLTNV